jgi:hypothetical protein
MSVLLSGPCANTIRSKPVGIQLNTRTAYR